MEEGPASRTRSRTDGRSEKDSGMSFDSTEAGQGSSITFEQMAQMLEMMNRQNQTMFLSTIESLFHRLGQSSSGAPSSQPIISTGYEPKTSALSLEKTLTPPKLTSSVNFSDWAMQFRTVLSIDGLDEYLTPIRKLTG